MEKGSPYLKTKGILEALLESLNVKADFVPFEKVAAENNEWFENGVSAKVMTDDRQLGVIGQVDKDVLGRFGIESEIAVFDLDFDLLEKLASIVPYYQPIPKYPPIIEDLSFIVPEKTYVGKIIDEIKRINKLVNNISLLDSYKNVRTFRIFYQDPKRNLTTREVEKIRKEIIRKLQEKFGLKLKEGGK